MKARRLLTIWHRWFGLGAALWLLLLALTGSAIAFHDEIDRALNPALRRVAPAGPALSLDRIAAAIERQEPNTTLDYIMLPTRPDDAILGFVAPRRALGQAGAPGHVFRQYYVDPYRGSILGTRIFGEFGLDARRLMPFLYQLHMDLMLGGLGKWLLGLVALLWIIDHLISVAISFPRRRAWMDSFMLRWRAGGYRLRFDLHRAIGLWLFPVTLVLALTGLSVTWTETFDHAVSAVSPTSGFPIDDLPVLPAPLYSPVVSIDSAVAIAERRAGSRVNAISLHPDKGVYWLRLFDRRDLDQIGQRWVVVDYRTGRVLQDRHVTEGSNGDAFTAWLFPLHNGAALGLPGRILIALSGVLLSVVVVTGLTIWTRKQYARRASAGRGSARLPLSES